VVLEDGARQQGQALPHDLTHLLGGVAGEGEGVGLAAQVSEAGQAALCHVDGVGDADQHQPGLCHLQGRENPLITEVGQTDEKWDPTREKGDHFMVTLKDPILWGSAIL
jgi:hypothetical protein